MDHSVETVMTRARGAQSVQTLWDIVAGYFTAHGAERLSYHLYRSPTATEARDVTVVTQGFSQEWVCQYIDEKLYRVDPIPLLARTATSPFFWDDIADLVKTTPAQKTFLKRLKGEGIRNGVAFQVYGPGLRNGYVGLGFAADAPRPSAQLVFEFQCVAQIGHLRYCDLSAQDEHAPLALSPREREVLQWMAHGKSNSVIAQIMGVSRHTIDTLVRRVYEKVGVNDRTTAVLRGVGSGLILG